MIFSANYEYMNFININKIQNADIKNKRVLLRVDFNVSIENKDVKEKYKILAAKESIDYLLKKGVKVALLSHLGRPAANQTLTDTERAQFSFEQLIDDVEELLNVKVKFIPDCIGEKVKKGLDDLKADEVLLLENVRFYEGEESNNKEFADKLAQNFDIFANDAFSVCHRDQASVTGITAFLPSFGGFWLQKEITNLDKIKNNPERPAVAIIGGAKIETKLSLIEAFEKIYDAVLVGGKIANEVIDENLKFSEKVILPMDFAKDRLDIGPETISHFKSIISGAKTIVWNGPMGKFEELEYAIGTKEIFDAIISSKAHILAGGGETVEVIEKENAMNKISFISTGGGAMLEYLSGNPMPGLEALQKEK